MEEIEMEYNDKHKLKIFSKIVAVLALIGNIFLIIGLPFLVLLMVAIPVLFKDVKIEERRFAYKDIVALQIDEEKTKIDVIYKGDIVHTEENAQTIIKLLDKIDQKATDHIVRYIDAEIGIILVQVIISIAVLTQIRKLFNNISNGDTPFTIDNVMHLQKAAYLEIIAIFIPYILGIVLSLVLGISIDNSILSTNLIELFAILSLVYIFKYGCVLQNKSKITLKD